MIRAGDVLTDRYEVGALLAAGGMADVHLARDLRLDRDVAVKVFRIGAGDSRRFEAETKMLSGLAHPNLVAVFDAGEHDGTPYVVLQRIDGPTLTTRLREGPLSDDEARRLGSDVAAALEYVHRRRIVHRDVKPSNILFDEHGNALLADFGVAILLDATRLTLDTATVGTAGYLAPEQATGGEVTEGADIYSLGLVLLEALTGRPAFSGTMQEVLTARVARELEIPRTIAPAWASLLSSMTRRDAAVRLSATQVLDTVRNIGGITDPGTTQVESSAFTAVLAAGSPTAVRAPATDATATEPSRPATAPRVHRDRRPLIVAGAIALAVVLSGILLNAANGDDPPALPVATTTTTAANATTAPPAAPDDTPGALCADFERQKRDVEREKQRVEQQHREDEATRDRLKEELEADKRDIEAAKSEAGC